jgi:enterochelin esterase-like enzyme
MQSILGRRAFLTIAVASAATRADGPLALDFEVRDLREVGRRFTLCVPTALAAGERVPLLVLLHGLAETVDERLGAYAWLEKYGLGAAYDRLRRPPISRLSARAYWTDARLTEVNADLAARPFRGMVIACPFTPNPNRAANAPAVIEDFGRWIVESLLPRARAEAPVLEGAEHTAIDGCSLGGWIGLEVFLRRPEAFGAWGGVQSAIGEATAARYADRIVEAIAKVGPRAIHVESSSLDPFRAANEALGAALARKKIPRELRVLPGPHDQPWLREAGTIEMLHWHDRRVRAG